jgi:surfeit locus 1 family protein
MQLLRNLFSKRWIFTSILVVAATLVMARLGIWQLDRLAHRRAFNAQVLSASAMTALDLNQEVPEGLVDMEWRSVRVTGTYDFDNQVALRNQYYRDRSGYHLITPLRFSGKVVLVDRGWIPFGGSSEPLDWRTFDESGEISVEGQIRLGQEKPAIGGLGDPLTVEGEKLLVWNNLDLERIADQMPYPILPVIIQPNADENDNVPPIPFQPEQDLTEGPHFGYAMQWFIFAGILFIGYPFYLLKQEQV